MIGDRCRNVPNDVRRNLSSIGLVCGTGNVTFDGKHSKYYK
jgi:hypothetical protein